MAAYMIFGLLIAVFVVAFVLLWKKRKNKRLNINDDPWKDVAIHTPDDNII